MKIPTIYNFGIQVGKPWTSEMYAFNDSLCEDYKEKILEAINKVKSFEGLNDLARIINPSSYGEGFTLESAKEDMVKNLDMAENYWIHEINSHSGWRRWLPLYLGERKDREARFCP